MLMSSIILNQSIALQKISQFCILKYTLPFQIQEVFSIECFYQPSSPYLVCSIQERWFSLIVAHYTHSVVFGSFSHWRNCWVFSTERTLQPTPSMYHATKFLLVFAAFAMHRYTFFLTFFVRAPFLLRCSILYALKGSQNDEQWLG